MISAPLVAELQAQEKRPKLPKFEQPIDDVFKPKILMGRQPIISKFKTVSAKEAVGEVNPEEGKEEGGEGFDFRFPVIRMAFSENRIESRQLH